MKKKVKFLLTFLIGACVFTSCFHIKETIKLNNNGSGRYTMLVDMSSAMSMIEMMKGMTEENAEDGEASVDTSESSEFDGMDSSFVEMREEISSIDGISDIEVIKDEEKYTFGLSFSFDNTDALNEAMEKMRESQSSKNKTKTSFAVSNGVFSRSDEVSFMESLKNEIGSDEKSQMGLLMMRDLTYTTEYIFDNKVKSVSNKNAVISQDGKTVTVKHTVAEMMGGDVSYDNKIRFK